jgi:hypothetical protein
MKPAMYVAAILVAFAILAPVVGRALPERGGKTFSGSAEFTIDGRTFRVKDPAVDGRSLIERELAKRGIEALPVSTGPIPMLDSRPVEALDEEPAEKVAPAVPRGLEPDHVMRLETGTGPVEIVVGRMVCEEKDILGRLRTSGWECRDSGMHGAIAHVTKDKEALFVVLEESNRRFLAIRRAVR